MSVPAMVSISNAPRDLNALMSLTRSVRQRLAHQAAMLSDQDRERAFMEADDAQQSKAILDALTFMDAQKNGASPAPTEQEGAVMSQLPPVVHPQGFSAPSMPTAGPQIQQPQMPQGFPMPGQNGMPPNPGMNPMAGFPQPGGMPPMTIPTTIAPQMQVPQQMQAQPAPQQVQPKMPPMNFPGFPGQGVAPQAAAQAPINMPGMPGMPGAAVKTSASTVSTGDMQTILQAMKDLVVLIRTTTEASSSVTADLLNHTARNAGDINLILRIQMFIVAWLAGQAGMSMEQAMTQMSQFISQTDQSHIDYLRALQPQVQVQAPKQGKG